MALRIENLTTAVRDLARTTAERAQSSHLEEARTLLHSLEADALRDKINRVQERVPWLVALPTDEPPGATFPLPPIPRDHTVVATDGSHMAPDRHSPVQFIVLNLGLVHMRYGSRPAAWLHSRGHLWYREEETHHVAPDGTLYPIEGALLGVEMALQELEALAELAHEAEPPALALRDGSLIFWPIQNEDPPLQDLLLPRVRRALRAFHDLGIPVASFISYPGARDLVNSLRIWLCGHCVKDRECGQCTVCTPEEATFCRWLRPVRDRTLLENILQPGERSAIFQSTSALLERYQDPDGVDHRILFFYVHTGREIARVEAPAWVMETPAYRDLVHAVVVDQCYRGGGYPPALQEAHEQAVITAGDRQMVQTLVEQELARLGIPYTRSMKDWSKRLRGI